VEQELLTLPEHLSTPQMFSVVRVARSFVFCVVFCASLFVPLSFFFWPFREVITTNGTYPWSFVTKIVHSGQPSHGDDRKTFEEMTST
jgi:hypothetical protein